MKRVIKNIKSDNRGFTLLEVITAIFILTVGVGASFTLIYQTLIVASGSSYSLTASYLAQEGVELAKNMRDYAWLQNIQIRPDKEWNLYIPDGVWEADYLDTSLNRLYTGTPLNIDSNGFYSYSAGTATIFTRKITVQDTPVVDPNKKEIIVEVSWTERGRTHSVHISETVTNWLETKLNY